MLYIVSSIYVTYLYYYCLLDCYWIGACYRDFSFDDYQLFDPKAPEEHKQNQNELHATHQTPQVAQIRQQAEQQEAQAGTNRGQ